MSAPSTNSEPLGQAADAGAPPGQLVEQLAAQLAEKDALVAALTAQLERAAEQLDRLQRSGADRRKHGFMPAELAADHKQLIGDLQRVVQQWEDMQAGLTLGRIEVQLTELREFVAGRLHGSFVPAPVESSESLEIVEEPCTLSSAANSGESSEWDRIKSQLLEPQEAVTQEPQPVVLEPMPDPPPPVDFATATVESLSAAVETRDEYIGHLLRRLRTHEAAVLPMDWSHVDQHDPELAQRLQQLALQLEEKLRLAEVELSLERARLAREHGRLQLKQELIEKQLKRLGLSSVEEAEASTPAAGSQQERRWVRFLGKGRNPS